MNKNVKKKSVVKNRGWVVKRWPKRHFISFYFFFFFCKNWTKSPETKERCARDKLIGVEEEKN